eukprot:TRINITY_DN6068_c0_g1_i8.p1 TRINITY_DN6068_c0_g1~~TRINITY_DN6068_c0_g1_i8.p1  ORF type:complete len:423 (+),score=123.02 TRINITY_DN6068_c0_g1_i8:325-1593(+)
MKKYLDLKDVIYSELCSMDFYSSVLPLQENSKKIESLIISKSKVASVEDYLKLLHHTLTYACQNRFLSSYLLNDHDEIFIMKDASVHHQFVLLQFQLKDKPAANYSLGDFILISASPASTAQLVHVIAAVDSYNFPSLTAKTVLKLNESDARSLAFRDRLRVDEEWHVRKLYNASQCIKEYESLQFVEELLLIDELIDAESSGNEGEVYKVSSDVMAVLNFELDSKQIETVGKAMKRNGISIVIGEAGTGKSEVLACCILGLMNVIDETELMKPKKYTIHELLLEDDPDYADNYMQDSHTKLKLAPWLDPEYPIGKLTAEDLALEKKSVSYKKASETDMKVALKRRNPAEYRPPKDVLVCCNTSKSLDRLMHKFLNWSRKCSLKGVDKAGARRVKEEDILRLGITGDEPLKAFTIESKASKR